MTATTATTTSSPLAARPGRLAVLLGAMTALGGFSLDSNTSGFPAMRSDLGASTSAVQLTLTSVLIGLTIGQLVIGPLSDRFGRRRPMLISLAAYVVLSVVCAVLDDVWLLVLARFVQGVFAASGMVIARAIARDLFHGITLTKFYAQLVSVTMLLPIIAPLIGSQLLPYVGWRGLFLVMAAIGLALAVAFAALVPETLSQEHRESAIHDGDRLLSGFGRLLRLPSFVAVGFTLGLSFGAVMVYTAGASFLLQDHYGLSPQGFGCSRR
jgi:DHA1 family bicyclomycin/chloramphenicol resistance-like MFS transporter